MEAEADRRRSYSREMALKRGHAEQVIMRASRKYGFPAFRIRGKRERALPHIMIFLRDGRTIFVYSRSNCIDITPDERLIYEVMRENNQRVYIVTETEAEAFVNWLIEEMEVDE